jgi:hypothetical protein
MLLWRRARGGEDLKDIEGARVNGEMVVDEGKLVTIDEEKLVESVQKKTEAVWSRISESHYLGHNMMRYHLRVLKYGNLNYYTRAARGE